jgi:hypothetical protein
VAGPSIVVRVLGDLKNLSQSFDSAGGKIQGVAQRGAAAFHGFLGGINATGALGPMAPLLDGIDQGIQRIAEHGAKLGPTMLGAGGAITGVGAALSAFGSKEQAAQQQLSAAISATGHTYDEYGSKIEGAVKHGETFGKTSADTKQALQVLTQATHDPARALDLLGTAFDLSAAKHEDLTGAAGQIAKAFNGNKRLFKEFGVVAGKDAPANLATLSGVLKGQASASADTFGGKLKGLQAKAEDVISTFGAKWGQTIQIAGAALMGLGSIFTIVGGMELATVWPIALIVLGVVALIAIGVLLWKNWGTIWGWIKGAISDVWDWIKDHWPLLLAILLGPIALAVLFIVNHWDTIKKGIKAVWDWIKDNWPLLLEILTGPIGWAVALITNNWDTIKQAASDTVDFIKRIWGDVVGFFRGLAGDIGNAFSGVFDALAQPFKDAWNTIKGVVDDIKGAVRDVGNAVSNLPGAGLVKSVAGVFGLQHGGIVTRPTLALIGEAGPEAVVPLRGTHAVGGGPAVVINNAHFSDQADIDLFMARAAWHAQTSRI